MQMHCSPFCRGCTTARAGALALPRPLSDAPSSAVESRSHLRAQQSGRRVSRSVRCYIGRFFARRPLRHLHPPGTHRQTRADAVLRGNQLSPRRVIQINSGTGQATFWAAARDCGDSVAAYSLPFSVSAGVFHQPVRDAASGL